VEVNPTGNGKLEAEAIEPFETRSFHTVLSGSRSLFLFLFYFYLFFNLGQSRIDSHKHNRGARGLRSLNHTVRNTI